jgi:iron(III) transport system substrate-binding protein
LPPGSVGFDIFLGGGTFEHDAAKAGVVLQAPGVEGGRARLRMAAPAAFEQARLDEWYGENRCGAQPIYDPQQFWLGTALSSFGIVYNRDVLRELGLPEPTSFQDLIDPRYLGRLALADPRQSGSMTTTFDSILGFYGWEKGWRILRAMSANARYFTSASTKPPIDISQGEAAAGLAIDFYGRSQAQAVAPEGRAELSRVGFTDPRGAVYIDADPVTILAGGPHPDIARCFVEFCLTEEAQALWQFPPRSDPRSASNPTGDDGEPMGPRDSALRRLPVRRIIYEKYLPFFVDQVNPFEIASDVKNPGWRTGVEVMMGAFAVDSMEEAHDAARALAEAKADPSFPAATATEMERLFYSFPATIVPAASPPEAPRNLEFTEQNYRALREAWRDPAVLSRCKLEYGEFFRANYRRIVQLGRSARVATDSR